MRDPYEIGRYPDKDDILPDDHGGISRYPNHW